MISDKTDGNLHEVMKMQMPIHKATDVGAKCYVATNENQFNEDENIWQSRKTDANPSMGAATIATIMERSGAIYLLGGFRQIIGPFRFLPVAIHAQMEKGGTVKAKRSC